MIHAQHRRELCSQHLCRVFLDIRHHILELSIKVLECLYPQAVTEGVQLHRVQNHAAGCSPDKPSAYRIGKQHAGNSSVQQSENSAFKSQLNQTLKVVCPTQKNIKPLDMEHQSSCLS